MKSLGSGKWKLAVVLATAASGASAQAVPAGLVVVDANAQLVGQVVDLNPDAFGIYGNVRFATSMDGHSLIGDVQASGLHFRYNQTVVFELADCSGQAWIRVEPGQDPAPRLVEPHLVTADRAVWVGSRSAAEQSVNFASFRDEGGSCSPLVDSMPSVVPATKVGTLPGYTPPFRIVPGAIAAVSASMPVAAVSPAALAFLAALLLLTGIAFVGKRAGRR